MDDILRIEPGKLRERISFYTYTSSSDGAGGYNNRVETLAFSTACALAPKGSVKTYEGNKTEYIEVWDLLMRYDTARIPTEQMLAKYKGETYNVLGIENVLTRNLVLKIKIARK